MATLAPAPPLAIATGNAAATDVAWSSLHLGPRRVRYATVTPTTHHATPTGPTLVWLHGWGLSPAPYLPGLRRFAHAAAATIHALALPGFGGSDCLPLRHQGVDGVARHLAGAIDALGLDAAPIIAGHSFGGGISIRLAALRPDLAARVHAFCPVGGAGDHPLPLPRVLAAIGADGIHRWTPAALRAAAPNLRHHPVAVLGSAFAAWRADLVDDLATLSAQRVPTNVVFADADGVVTPGRIPHLRLPGVRVARVPGRHSWLLTDPAGFADGLAADVAAGR